MSKKKDFYQDLAMSESSNNSKVVVDQREDLKKIQNEIEELKRLIVKLSR